MARLIGPRRGVEGAEGAGATGLEPAASGVTGRRSNQLNYAPAQGMVEFIKRGRSFLTYVYVVPSPDGSRRHAHITTRGFPLSRECRVGEDLPRVSAAWGQYLSECPEFEGGIPVTDSFSRFGGGWNRVRLYGS